MNLNFILIVSLHTKKRETLLKNAILLSMIGLILSACNPGGSDTAAVTNDGLCKQSAIDAYNAVVTKANSMRYSSRTSTDYRELNSNCESYKSLIGSQTCKASVGGSEQSISSASLDDVCNVAKSALGI